MSFRIRQSFICVITLLITGYMFNFTSIPNEIISNQLEYDINANSQELEIYLFVFSFVCFYYITSLGLSPHKLIVNKIETQAFTSTPHFFM